MVVAPREVSTTKLLVWRLMPASTALAVRRAPDGRDDLSGSDAGKTPASCWVHGKRLTLLPPPESSGLTVRGGLSRASREKPARHEQDLVFHQSRTCGGRAQILSSLLHAHLGAHFRLLRGSCMAP